MARAIQLNERNREQVDKLSIKICRVRRRSVIGRVPASQPCDLGSIPGGIVNFNIYLGLRVCPLFVFCSVLSLAVILTLC